MGELWERSAAGAFDGSDYGLGFVAALFEFFFGDGVGDDAGAGLDVAFVPFMKRVRMAMQESRFPEKSA